MSTHYVATGLSDKFTLPVDGPLPYSSTEKGPAVTFVQPGQVSVTRSLTHSLH